MTLEFLVRGLIIGLIASITLGPVGVLCIQRTLSKNRKAGLVSGFGAATADTMFATVAFFFIALVNAFIEEHMNLITLIGGGCVTFVGIRIYMSNPVVQIRRNRAGKTNLWQDFISTFFLTLTNPAFILWLMVIFSAFNLNYDATAPDQPTRVAGGILMISGFFGGACLWWYLLTLGVNTLRRRFRPRHLLWLNRTTGVIIALLGTGAVITTAIKMIRL